MIRVELAHAFYMGDDVVLVSMDGAGAMDLRSALASSGSGNTWQFAHEGTDHQFSIEEGDMRIEISAGLVRWRANRKKIAEMCGMLMALTDAKGPGHQYLDIGGPAKTLVLSRDEC
jgi:hypothetical protein